ncbi:MAG TPA: ABC transporter substrate-binding protein [Bacillota bacterium]|nr:ABC transporter substrate-binding protein [Bacillota bacterium]HPT87218.1 ABC transporter substrate-binding protein [Bacillota bacterium]
MKVEYQRVIFGCILIAFMVFGAFDHKVCAANIVETIKPKYTQGFLIERYPDGIKRIRDNDGRLFWLVPEGKKAPGGIDSGRIIPVPLRRGLFASVSQVCLLRPFADPSVWESVTGVAAPAEEWYIPQIRSGLQSGRIVYIGDAYSPDYERVQQLRPDVVFIYTGPSGLTALARKLDTLGLTYIAENSYLETDPLGRLEWVKFFAAFYNREKEAIRYFDEAVQRVNKLKAQIPSGHRVKVAWGVIYHGKAYVPGRDSFVTRMIEMAGGENVFSRITPGKGSVAVTMEHFLAYGKKADVMVYASFPQFAPSIKELIRSTPLLAEFEPVRRGNVWVLQPWYNQQQDRTDAIISDLAAIFYPGKFGGRAAANFLKLK